MGGLTTAGLGLLTLIGSGALPAYMWFTDEDSVRNDLLSKTANPQSGVFPLNPVDKFRAERSGFGEGYSSLQEAIATEKDLLEKKEWAKEREKRKYQAITDADIYKLTPQFDQQKRANELLLGKLGMEFNLAQSDRQAANQNALRQYNLDKIALQNQANSYKDNYQFKLQELDLMRQRDQMAYDQFMETEKFRKEERRQKRMDALLLALTGLTSDSIRYL